MGRRPRPKPVKELEGTARADREIDATVEDPDVAVVESAYGPPPEWFPELAAIEWIRVVPILEARRVITAGDFAVVVSWCLTVGEIQELTETIATEPEFYGDTMIRRHPAYSARRAAMGTLAKLGSCLGLTPADRSRVPGISTPSENPIRKLQQKSASGVAN